jgi:hypothetical protein
MDGVEFVKRLIVPSPRERLSVESALKASWLSRKQRDSIPETEGTSIAQTAVKDYM